MQTTTMLEKFDRDADAGSVYNKCYVFFYAFAILLSSLNNGTQSPFNLR